MQPVRVRTVRNVFVITTLFLITALGLLFLTPAQKVKAQSKTNLPGGASGAVKNSKGSPVEGIMVQLISEKNSIRTTVYTNELGKYEFPRLDSGDYTLRIARPLEYQRYQKDSVRIDGATELADITLERVTDSEFLPPTPDILPQLTEAEWLANLPGTGQEKKSFINSCGGSCHGFQMQMRARFDEDSWRKIVHRMTDYGGRTLVGGPENGKAPIKPFVTPVMAGLRLAPGEVESVVKWLSRVRGPDAQDPPMRVFPRPQGPSTRAIVTEYEIPWVGVIIHDVAGDSQGNIWFTSNRSPFIGKLDPKTGKIISYRTPTVENKHPGEHWIQVDKNGIVWFSATWADGLGRFDPRTQTFRMVYGGPTHNTALSPDGSLWRNQNGSVNKFDPDSAKFWETAKPAKQYPLPMKSDTYGSALSWDGNYFGGGGNKGIVLVDTRTGETREVPTVSGISAHGRGNFDPDGNLWLGSKAGSLIKYDPRTNLVSEYSSPTPYTNFYSAKPDKNGEVWSGEMHGGRVARFNPRTYRWIEYQLPSVWSFDFTNWIDNSTNPVSYWYGDYYGYLVHIQPLE